MPLLVQKYGGSSLASAEKLRGIARRIAELRGEGHDVVVVVSAMGSTTERLLGLARDVTEDPCHRELDILLSSGERVSKALLALAIRELGLEAISLSGPQAGIRTCDQHFNANIRDVRPDRVRAELDQGRVVVVAGYQGTAPNGEITTLGRGGSDTSAVALAAALDADRCEICSDVEGVYSADPRVVESAFPLSAVSYDEMLEMARQGASVLQTRAVLHAREESVPLRARGSFSESPGTRVGAASSDAEPAVAGIAGHDDLVRLSFLDDEPRLPFEILGRLGISEVFLGDPGSDHTEVLLPAEEVPDPESLETALARSHPERVRVTTGLGSASAVGLGIASAPELRTEFDRVLDDRFGPGRTVERPHSLTRVLDGEHVASAMNALHGSFLADRSAGGALEAAS